MYTNPLIDFLEGKEMKKKPVPARSSVITTRVTPAVEAAILEAAAALGMTVSEYMAMIAAKSVSEEEDTKKKK
jgi:uncharacterized protein (DUF1778 family)